MFAPAISKVREFLGSWRNLLALGTLPFLGAWIYSRVWMVNPAILGDEYLYSMNARKVGPWDPPVAGDFSNYLFNFVYQGTNLCGESFYSCVKLLNISFFLTFVFIIFVIASKLMSFTASYLFMLASALSPLGIYTSMFLPESMYFAGIGVVLLTVLRAMREMSAKNLVVVGLSVGILSLVKPHAWLSVIAIAITFIILSLTGSSNPISSSFKSLLWLAGGAVVGRVVVGVLVGGPKSLDFFGQYLGVGTVEKLISSVASEDATQGLATSPVDGVTSLFASQLWIHLLTVFAVMGIAVVGLIVGIVSLSVSKELSPVNGFALFTFIWLFSMMIEIVVFTGWVTGTGDDHATRVLLRYYEFLFVIAPLAGYAALARGLAASTHVAIRWTLVGLAALVLTPAFTGFFGSLTIQIADAPTLAGFVVNGDIFNLAAVILFGSFILFAAFPQRSALGLAALLPFTMVATGFEIQNQYQAFRGESSVIDKAGVVLRDSLSDEQLQTIYVLADSRFDATLLGFWMDVPNVKYGILEPGATSIQTEIFEQSHPLIFIYRSDVDLVGPQTTVVEGDGFRVVDVSN